MTEKEAFKIGFLAQCAEEGLTPRQTQERIAQAKQAKLEKQANPLLFGIPAALAAAAYGVTKGVKNVGEGIGGLASGLGSLALPAAVIGVGAPLAAGAVAGHFAGGANTDPYSNEDARRDEEIAEYNRAVDQLHRSMRQKRKA